MRPASTLLALLGSVLLLSLVAVRRVTGPLTSLTRAAQELGNDIDRPPLPETGLTAVRRAAKPFNTTQQRLQRFLSDHTGMLAAISHDLKTPITRMQGRTEIVVEDDASQLVLRILDNGPGLAPDQLEQAFAPFFRAEASRSRETGGTGLGLGIAAPALRTTGKPAFSVSETAAGASRP